MTNNLTDEDWESKSHEIMELFSPGAPIDADDLFAGRSSQIDLIIEAVLQRGLHAIIFGERGVGKTSLARTFYFRLIKPTKSIPCVIVNCDPSDTYSTLWKKIFADLKEQDGSNLTDIYIGNITPDDVRRVLSSFNLTTLPIIILDEFDKLVDQSAKTLVANTIKTLSDFSVLTTLVVVGIAKSVSELINEHQSISRALVQIQMPRMNSQELGEIIDKRLPKVGMSIQPGAKAQIVSLSRGLPHYTHLIGQFSARQAIQKKSLIITESHVDDAQKDCLDRVDQSIREQYHQATQSPRGGNIYKEVLLGCALAEPDDLGFFHPKAIELPLSKIMDKKYQTAMFGQHLKKLCEPERGKILEFTGSQRRFKYRFIEPLMQPYVILRGLRDGLIEKQLLNNLMPNPLQPRLSSEF